MELKCYNVLMHDLHTYVDWPPTFQRIHFKMAHAENTCRSSAILLTRGRDLGDNRGRSPKNLRRGTAHA